MNRAGIFIALMIYKRYIFKSSRCSVPPNGNEKRMSVINQTMTMERKSQTSSKHYRSLLLPHLPANLSSPLRASFAGIGLLENTGLLGALIATLRSNRGHGRSSSLPSSPAPLKGTTIFDEALTIARPTIRRRSNDPIHHTESNGRVHDAMLRRLWPMVPRGILLDL